MVAGAAEAEICAGNIHYAGKTCQRCGDNLRYISNNRCVKCQLAANSSYKYSITLWWELDDFEEKMKDVWYG